MPKFTDKFDALYRRICPEVPARYLQTLAAYESNSNPADQGGIHWGLLQVGEKALADYNAAHDSNYKLVDVLSPTLNVKVFCEYYRRVSQVFEQLVEDLGADARNFVPDWDNPQYVALVTAAWNSGIGAVRTGARTYRKRMMGFPHAITHANVLTANRQFGSKKLKAVSTMKKQVWQQSVANTFVGMKDLPAPKAKGGKGGATPWLILILLLLASSRGSKK